MTVTQSPQQDSMGMGMGMLTGRVAWLPAVPAASELATRRKSQG